MQVPASIPAIVLALFLILLGFSETLEAFHARWWSSTLGYSHGYAVVAIVAWLIWKWRSRLSPVAPTTPLLILGGGTLVAVSVLWSAAAVTDVLIVQQLALPTVLLVWGLLILGPRSAAVLLPAYAISLLAVPVWDVLTEPLRVLTVAVNAILIRASGIPAFIEGARIDVPAGSFVVADGCSGLSYLLVGLLLGGLQGLLYLRSWRLRIAIMALGIAIALVANWVRVFGLIVVGHVTEMQSEMVEDHEFYGWVVFALFLVPFFALSAWIERFDRSPGPAAESMETGDGAAGAVRGRMLFATVLALIGPLMLLLADLSFDPSASTIARLEKQNGWQSVSGPAPLEPVFRGADTIHEAGFEKGGRQVWFTSAIYDQQDQGREAVSDLNRVARGGVISHERRRSSSLGGDVIEMRHTGPSGAFMIWRWYRIGGVRAVGDLEAKREQLLGWFRGRRDAQVLMLATRCATRACDGADASALAEFAHGAVISEQSREPGLESSGIGR